MVLPTRFPSPPAIALALAMAIVCAGCNPSVSQAPAWDRVSEASIRPGDTIPAPVGTPLLSVTGLVGVSDGDGAIRMDRETIEAVGLHEQRLLDPFEKREVLFKGVRFSDLLAVWQVADHASELQVLALNDYEASVPLDVLIEGEALLALYSDGEAMEPDYRGPAMIVFPYHARDFDHAEYEPWWVWQVASIDVR